MDVGKLIAFMSGQTRPVFDFEDREDWWTRADADGIAPIVAVPTTAGTGSEVGRAAVVTDPGRPHQEDHLPPEDAAARGHRRSRAHPRPAGRRSPRGPAWTRSSHSLEAWCSPFFHPLGEGIALEGLRLVQGVAAGRGRGRPQRRGARLHARRLVDGRRRLPEGPRRDARDEPSVLGAARHAPRPHQRGRHALRARPQPRRSSRRGWRRWRAISICPANRPQSVVEWVLALRTAHRHSRTR